MCLTSLKEELEAFAAKEDEGVGSGYESDSESAVSCDTDDMYDYHLGHAPGENGEREVDRGSDSATADSLGSTKVVSGRSGEDELQQSLLEEGPRALDNDVDDVMVAAGVTEKGVASSLGRPPVPTVSLTPAGASYSELTSERQLLTNSNESGDVSAQTSAAGAGGVSPSPRTGMELLDLSDTVVQRSGSESSDREDSGSLSRSRWKNPFMSGSPMSEFSLRQKWWTSEGRESSASAAERRGETFTLAIVSRRSRHRAGQYGGVVWGVA